MDIHQAGSRPAKPGPKEYFSGTVSVEPIIATANPPSRVLAASVAFEPGARTAWHTHPHGQTLHIVSGVGRVQKSGESVIEVYPGDTVWFEPGERHWHGAAPNRLMVHLAIQQTDAEGNSVTWLEQVTDADYNGRSA